MEPNTTGIASNADTEIYYETFGTPEDPTLLLVNGLGSQLISYRPEFCRRFVDSGFHVVRYDNREVGLSTKTQGRPPSINTIVKAPSEERESLVPYTIRDMAADGVAVLDALDVDAAHIWGMSMGGMIAQTMAVEFASRVLSLTSVMSTTGNPKVGGSTPEATKVLMTPPPPDREGAIANGVEGREVIGGSLYDPAESQALGEVAFDRCFHPIGSAFQMAAITAAGNRTKVLSSITAPTTVIHGRMDPLIKLSGGEATAEAIPGATLVVYDEMGHDIPEPLWDDYVKELVALAGRAP